MNVVTTDKRSKGQLALLLRDLGVRPLFYESLQAIAEELEEQKAKEAILLDLNGSWDEAQVRDLSLERHIIGFKTVDSANEDTISPEMQQLCITIVLLPNHAERAKVRLKNALKIAQTGKDTGKPFSRRTVSPFKRRIGTTRPPISLSPKKTADAVELATRYLTCHSPAAKSFLAQLRNLEARPTSCLLSGREDSEFELAAREMNFQANQDVPGLTLLKPDSLRLDELQRIERNSRKSGAITFCYVGRTDEFCLESIQELGLFINFLENVRDSALHLIIAHEIGSEVYFQSGVWSELINLRKRLKELSMPSMTERHADIRPICQSFLGQLRAAHPFLQVHQISEEAIQYLEENRQDFPHAKLIRTLRSAISLCQRSELQQQDIVNYGESNLTTQHLLESMADEQFFEDEKSANF